LPIGVTVAVFLLLAALDHLLTATTFRAKGPERGDSHGARPWPDVA